MKGCRGLEIGRFSFWRGCEAPKRGAGRFNAEEEQERGNSNGRLWIASENKSNDDVCSLLTRLGYAKRQRGTSHQVFARGDSYLNLQPGSDGKAKKYQVRQIRKELQRIDLHP